MTVTLFYNYRSLVGKAGEGGGEGYIDLRVYGD